MVFNGQFASGRLPSRRSGVPNLGQEVVRLNKLIVSGHYHRADREAAKHLRTAPDVPEFHTIRATAALLSGAPDKGLIAAENALELAPQHEDATLLKAECYLTTSQQQNAIECLQSYLSATESARVRLKLSDILMGARRYVAALEVLQPGLEIKADAQMVERIGLCFEGLGRVSDAISSFELGMKLDPKYRANFLCRAYLAHRHERADPRVFLLEVLQADPNDVYATAMFLWASRWRCDWDAFEKLAPERISRLAEHKSAMGAWSFLSLIDDPQASLKRQRIRDTEALRQLRLKKPVRAPLPSPAADGRIRIGYFSSDFHDHATLRLFSGVLRHHDSAHFELHCFDFGKRDSLSEECMGYFEQFHSVHNLSDADTTRLSRKVNLDIAVDLKGNTADGRPELFLLGQAPVQINYLGYPGTMGSRAYHYIIADHVVIPPGFEAFYDERIMRLPTCYLPSDDRRQADLPPTRTELGLPEDGVVLACLNAPYKISREIFEIWLTALKAAPNAVLWLLDGNEDSNRNLVEAALAAGISADRVIFAERLSHHEHITRLAQADLYLDTFNCNAHTLAAEALCGARVPILTCSGQQFAARVGASFITAAGLPELVCETKEIYGERLRHLAQDPSELTRLRGKICQNRATHSLFSSAAYTKYLENGLREAHRRARLRRSPKSFDIPRDELKGACR